MSRKAVVRKQPEVLGISSRIRQYLSVKLVIVAGTVLVILAIVAAIALNNMNQPAATDYSVPDSSKSFLYQGQQHIQSGEAHPAYNSNPPTSGWHYPQPAPWGIYQEILPDETVIHNMEHGGIWISYRNVKDQETIRQLEDIARRYPDHVIMTYRPTDDTSIVIAAWGRLLTLDTLDSQQIYNFINRYRLHGPENV